MRTQDDIVQKLRDNKGCFPNFLPEIMVPLLDFDHAKEFLKPEVQQESWQEPVPLTEESVKESMREYMACVGWEKVENHRGISAGRTVEKMIRWLWLLGDDTLFAGSAVYRKIAIRSREGGAPRAHRSLTYLLWSVPARRVRCCS